jgi:hypothetical protein
VGGSECPRDCQPDFEVDNVELVYFGIKGQKYVEMNCPDEDCLDSVDLETATEYAETRRQDWTWRFS